MKKTMLIMLAMLAICGVCNAQETGTDVSTTGASDTMGYVVAAVIAVINAILSFCGNSKESWWYKLLSWVSVRFGK